MTKFSIVMPVYNLKEYVSAAIQSVQSQNFSDWELVCVDDGSTDGSGRILDEYARKENRIKVVHKSNGGEGSARNVGLSHSTGEWIVFLDGDDVCHENTLSWISSVIEKVKDVDIVRFGVIQFSDGCSVGWQKIEYCSKIESVREVVSKCPYMGGVTRNCFRSECIRDIRFMDFCLGTDLAFCSEAYTHSKLVASNDGNFLYGYRRRTGSAVMSKTTQRKVLDQIAWRKYILMTWYGFDRSVLIDIQNGLARELTIGLVPDFCGLERKDRLLVWQVWLACMRQLIGAGIFSGWWKLLLIGVLTTRSFALFLFLFKCPFSLKRFLCRQ